MSKAVVSRPRVYIRIRPLNERESKEGKGETIVRGDPQHPDVLFVKKEDDSPELQARFDHVFDGSTTQKEVFDMIGPEVQRTLFSGYNACVFAYGQTGSGKTHTMEGDRTDGERGGLVPRLIRNVFDNFNSNPDITDAIVEVSLVQIYQEKVQDLLNQRKQLDIHMDRTSQYVARDATWRTVKNLNECMKLYSEASKMRATSATEMNLVSSRSHMILMMKLQWDEPTLPGSHAQVNLIDLAGSERINESGATGEVMMEAIHINKSLSALGNVIIKLVEQAKKPNRRIHIPYKDSKLTYLLQSSLGGSNLVHFVLAMSASAMWRSETTSTIEFGKRALQVVLRPVRNAIDYTRLAEMEAMIERMRSHIQSLEEELQTKKNSEAAGFLQMKHIANDNDDDDGGGGGGGGAEGRQRPRRRSLPVAKGGRTQRHLKRQTELSRIIANLPETFDDLTSHCILFSESKATFRELGGLEKLVHFVDKSVSTYYRSNAAQAVASVIDDTGRELFAGIGGIDALSRLLQVKEERCKEAACVALEVVCRGCLKNKAALPHEVYVELVDLIYGYPNQQVQEVACAAVATIVDGNLDGAHEFERLSAVPKLLETIRTTPEEVVNLTKAATNCVGRLAHGNPQTQELIASFDGVDLLIDVLFSPGGDRDHQVPILASYALVNLCCSNAQNLAIAKEHPQYDEVKYRLLEGIARAFGTNTAREGFGRATAQEATAPFPYYGVTVMDKWEVSSSGGRPIYSTFMDNPQFYLYVHESITDIAFIVQDTLYEARMRKKRKNNAVYMGVAVFEGDADLAKAGLKQINFHGKLLDIAKYTSNCENTLHCRLPPSDKPYIVVPFTSQRGRRTQFALSAFGDHPIEFTAVPEHVGWVHTVLDGRWNEFTGRSADDFDWRCNPQISITPRDDCRVVLVLSYLSLDKQRNQMQNEEEEEAHQNTRPRLHGRIFTNEFAPEKRYLKALVPLPQGSTFVASNSFASNCYITTSATLRKGVPYVYIPFTETPFQDSFRVSVYCDIDDVAISPLQPLQGEWLSTSFAGTFTGAPVSVQLGVTGRVVAVANSPTTFLRVRLFDAKTGKKVGGIDSYWNSEAAVEYSGSGGEVKVQVEGVARGVNPETQKPHQEPARDRKFDLFIFSESKCTVSNVSFNATPSAWPVPTQSTSSELLQYPHLVEDAEAGLAAADDDDDDDASDGDSEAAADAAEREAELLQELNQRQDENQRLQKQVEVQEAELRELRSLKENGDSAKGPPLSISPPVGESNRKLSSGSASPVGASGLAKANGKAPLSGSQRGSATGSGRPPQTTATTAGRRSSSQPSVVADDAVAAHAEELRKSVEYTLSKLSLMPKKAPASAEEWKKVQRSLEDVQQKLSHVLGKTPATARK